MRISDISIFKNEHSMPPYNEIIIKHFRTDFGELILGSYNEMLCLCDWKYRKMRSEIDERIQKGLSVTYKEGTSQILEKTISQLQEYFLGKRKEFDIPLLLIGSEFQKQVWEALKTVSFGDTKTYLELSSTLGNKKAIRAVASANGANANSIIVPCHRIIGSKGELTGYAGGLNTKKKLLKHEAEISGTAQLELF